MGQQPFCEPGHPTHLGGTGEPWVLLFSLRVLLGVPHRVIRGNDGSFGVLRRTSQLLAPPSPTQTHRPSARRKAAARRRPAGIAVPAGCPQRRGGADGLRLPAATAGPGPAGDVGRRRRRPVKVNHPTWGRRLPEPRGASRCHAGFVASVGKAAGWMSGRPPGQAPAG